MVGKWAGAGRGGQGAGPVREALAERRLSSELVECDNWVGLVLVLLQLNFTAFQAGVLFVSEVKKRGPASVSCLR